MNFVLHMKKKMFFLKNVAHTPPGEFRSFLKKDKFVA